MAARGGGIAQKTLALRGFSDGDEGEHGQSDWKERAVSEGSSGGGRGGILGGAWARGVSFAHDGGKGEGIGKSHITRWHGIQHEKITGPS